MKKICYILVCLCCFLGACKDHTSTTSQELSADKIYFFYSNYCPHCHDALNYLNSHYPDLKLSMVNVSNSNGNELLFKCAKKFKLGNQIGTPLFCMGDKYIMGWSEQNASQFEEYVKPYLNK